MTQKQKLNKLINALYEALKEKTDEYWDEIVPDFLDKLSKPKPEVVGEPKLSPKAKKIKKLVEAGDFGCRTKAVAALCSTIIEEHIPVVKSDEDESESIILPIPAAGVTAWDNDCGELRVTFIMDNELMVYEPDECEMYDYDSVRFLWNEHKKPPATKIKSFCRNILDDEFNVDARFIGRMISMLDIEIHA